MSAPVEQDTTHCTTCDGDLVYRLDVYGLDVYRGDVAHPRGLRYTVSCPSCDEVVYEFCAPQFDLRAAA